MNIRSYPVMAPESGNDPAVADVYAGDTTPADAETATTNVYVFTLEADAAPDVLVRVAGVFNLANVGPLSVSLRRTPSEQVNISVAIALTSAAKADMIRRKLAQLTCTISVDWVERSAE